MPNKIGVPDRDRVSVDGHQRIGRLTASQFLGQTVADFEQRLHDLHLYHCPIGFRSLALQSLAQQARVFAGSSHLVAQVWEVDDLFNFAQTIRPWPERATGNRPFTKRAVVIE